ncbi:MAG: hypothetical protein QNK11_07070 [Legionella sp.]|nr:hypothetical protein [Legionella sp.]
MSATIDSMVGELETVMLGAHDTHERLEIIEILAAQLSFHIYHEGMAEYDTDIKLILESNNLLSM